MWIARYVYALDRCGILVRASVDDVYVVYRFEINTDSGSNHCVYEIRRSENLIISILLEGACVDIVRHHSRLSILHDFILSI